MNLPMQTYSGLSKSRRVTFTGTRSIGLVLTTKAIIFSHKGKHLKPQNCGGNIRTIFDRDFMTIGKKRKQLSKRDEVKNVRTILGVKGL